MFKYNSKYVDDKEYVRLKRLEKQRKPKKKYEKKVKKKKLKSHIKIKPAPKFHSYKEYMQSKEWRNKRKQVLKRAGNMCESCKIKKARQVHHKTYKHLYNEPLTDLIALCGICHQDKHGLLTEDYIDKKVYELIQRQGI